MCDYELVGPVMTCEACGCTSEYDEIVRSPDDPIYDRLCADCYEYDSIVTYSNRFETEDPHPNAEEMVSMVYR